MYIQDIPFKNHTPKWGPSSLTSFEQKSEFQIWVKIFLKIQNFEFEGKEAWKSMIWEFKALHIFKWGLPLFHV